METIGLRELNQHPSRVVSRVRAGVTVVVTDRGKPVLRLVPETEHSSLLQRMLDAGEMRPPVEHGMPELAPDLAAGIDSVSDHLLADRAKERNR